MPLTYIVNLSEFQLVLVFVIKSCAIFVDEAHNRSLPAWRSQKSNDHIEEPVLINVMTRLDYAQAIM